jgi:hypothetical protein
MKGGRKLRAASPAACGTGGSAGRERSTDAERRRGIRECNGAVHRDKRNAVWEEGGGGGEPERGRWEQRR